MYSLAPLFVAIVINLLCTIKFHEMFKWTHQFAGKKVTINKKYKDKRTDLEEL